jgi:hypothetical protein
VAATLQEVFERSFDEYAGSRRLPQHLVKAAQAIRQCRTAALGGHVLGCSEGHVAGVWYNSCRHRSCPQCGFISTEQWLDAQKDRLLACDHYHVVFTLPHELDFLWHTNRSSMTDLLYRCARETLFELLGDEKYLGAQPGVLATLHTWGRTLSFHPHLHCLVTGGGWTGTAWRPVNGGFLLPFQVVRALFRGKLLSALQQAISQEVLALPAGQSHEHVKSTIRKLWRKKWNVRVRERYAHGAGVVTYLARYLRQGPISNRRLLAATGDGVTFGYTDHRDQRRKTMTLTGDDFVRRILWHVPEPGTHAVRYWGLYGRTKAATRAVCRAALGQPAFEEPKLLSTAEYCERRGWHPARRCEECGRPLLVLAEVSRSRAPPAGLPRAA